MDVGCIQTLMPYGVAFSTSQSIHLVEPHTVATSPWFLVLRHVGFDVVQELLVLGVMVLEDCDN